MLILIILLNVYFILKSTISTKIVYFVAFQVRINLTEIGVGKLNTDT